MSNHFNVQSHYPYVQSKTNIPKFQFYLRNSGRKSHTAKATDITIYLLPFIYFIYLILCHIRTACCKAEKYKIVLVIQEINIVDDQGLESRSSCVQNHK